jgi:hypothetical protein
MKHLIYNTISWTIGQGALALICTLTYNYLLIDIFLVEINYINWLGIIIVAACILPMGRKIKNSDTPDMKSKIDTFISSMTTRNDKKRV